MSRTLHETPDVRPCRTSLPMPFVRTRLARNAWCNTMSHLTATGRGNSTPAYDAQISRYMFHRSFLFRAEVSDSKPKSGPALCWQLSSRIGGVHAYGQFSWTQIMILRIEAIKSLRKIHKSSIHEKAPAGNISAKRCARHVMLYTELLLRWTELCRWSNPWTFAVSRVVYCCLTDKGKVMLFRTWRFEGCGSPAEPPTSSEKHV